MSSGGAVSVAADGEHDVGSVGVVGGIGPNDGVGLGQMPLILLSRRRKENAFDGFFEFLFSSKAITDPFLDYPFD